MIMYTVEERIKYRINELKSLELYFYSDNRSLQFFQENPENTEELIVNEKISALNNGIIDISFVPALAQHIISLSVDRSIKEKNLQIVNQMASLEDQDPSLSMKHFCSMYCNYHNHNNFPIHSPVTIELLNLLEEKSPNLEAKHLELTDYPQFKVGIDLIINKYDLSEMNYYELHKFFWINESRIKEFIASL